MFEPRVGMKVRHKGYVNPRPGVYDEDKSQPFNNYGINQDIRTDKIYIINGVFGNSVYLKEFRSWTFHRDEFISAEQPPVTSFFD